MTAAPLSAPAPAPLLALTMGDPCGIGPEILVRAVAAGVTGPALVVGDVAVLRRAVAQCGLRLPVARLASPSDGHAAPLDCLRVWQPPGSGQSYWNYPTIDPATGWYGDVENLPGKAIGRQRHHADR